MIDLRAGRRARRRAGVLRAAAAGPPGAVARRARDARVAPGDDRRPPHARPSGRPTGHHRRPGAHVGRPRGRRRPRGRPAQALGGSTADVRAVLLDVFTDRPLTGNQLAVFLDGPSVPEELRQDVAREIGFSETVFVDPPSHPTAGDVRARIFTPEVELPFAGHPVLGTAVAVAADRGLPPGSVVTLECGVGSGARRARRRPAPAAGCASRSRRGAPWGDVDACSPPSACGVGALAAPRRGLRQRPDPPRRGRRRRRPGRAAPRPTTAASAAVAGHDRHVAVRASPVAGTGDDPDVHPRRRHRRGPGHRLGRRPRRRAPAPPRPRRARACCSRCRRARRSSARRRCWCGSRASPTPSPPSASAARAVIVGELTFRL